MRPTAVLRIHPTPVLIPQMYLGATLRHPADARQHALWDQWREQEGYVGLWKKGEWYAMAPEKTVKLDMKARIKAILEAPFEPLPSKFQTKYKTEIQDVTSQLNSSGNDDGHSKKGGDKIEGMPIKKKVPAANVFWTDHLRML